jgi:succinyl-diaminopimelate desuccinylase
LQHVVSDIHAFLADRLDFEFEFDLPWIECAALADADNSELANAVLGCVTAVDGPHSAIGVPYGTNATRTCGAGVPSVVFGPGSIQQAHTRDEYIDIAQLEKAAEVYYQFCKAPLIETPRNRP